ncbi:aminodeoxychorismate synthase component I [Fodinibius halophilus]|uniref:aminodeoxychorismate synthase n=1 Tax=Fodinibius halophilus TaxID=1736908 RepID=A0A6M1SZH3_9BACT|nr:aminodeoxychorismate synthase component I [Fodinibius halophilus]NGP87029.1 aminodeoxychorismate synthase component I [Fodinibius halophilus]
MISSLHNLARNLHKQGPILLLESQSSKHIWGRTSYLAAHPKALIKARGRDITVIEEEEERFFEDNPWKALQNFRKKHDDWLFGYLGYDLKNHIEDLSSSNSDPVQAPDLFFMIPGLLIEYQHATGECRKVIGELPEQGLWEGTGNETPTFQLTNLHPQVGSTEYISKIKEVQHRIAEGDFYEINLSHQLKADFNGNTFDLYRGMRQAGPVPFGVYLDFEDISICCQSPERFIRKEGNTVVSQPIKGTSPRGDNTPEDERLKQALADSQKEQAENLMIVDLVRNDLSKIARRGTVEVPRLFEIQSFDTVHQMVSTVRAEADIDDPVAILKSCFPMGSMTGAPKISAMQAIEELEEYRRGIYSGAIGYIHPNGDFDFNVVIRTAIITGNELFYAAGGAITGDSDPQKEWQETLVKTRALERAIAEPLKK